MTPLDFQWSGEAMIPRYPRHADRLYTVGQDYALVEHVETSSKSLRHEFAWLREAWANLPDNLADQFHSPEHLRKRALIDAGFYHETVIDAGSNAAALRVAAYARHKDEFAHIVVRGPLVVERTAKSQSRRSMDRTEFQASKTALLDIVSAMIGVDPATLTYLGRRR